MQFVFFTTKECPFLVVDTLSVGTTTRFFCFFIRNHYKKLGFEIPKLLRNF